MFCLTSGWRSTYPPEIEMILFKIERSICRIFQYLSILGNRSRREKDREDSLSSPLPLHLICFDVVRVMFYQCQSSSSCHLLKRRKTVNESRTIRDDDPSIYSWITFSPRQVLLCPRQNSELNLNDLTSDIFMLLAL